MSSRFQFVRAPLRVYWETTRACDLACRHCRAAAAPEPDPAELTTAEGLRLLERLAAFGPPLPHVILTGGDPLKRADLFVLIDRARALGLGVSVAPSATPLLTPEAIRRLQAAGVEAISLSLDGAIAERHDAFRGVSGCFDRTLTAAAAAQAVALPFQVNTLVSEETLDDIPAVHRLVSRIGATRWSLFFLVTVGRGSVLRPITPGACDRLLEWLADLPRAGGLVISTTEAPHFRRVMARPGRRAGAGVLQSGHAGAGIRDGNGIMFISHIGEIQPSGFLPVTAGNVRSDDPVMIYREAPIFHLLRRVDLLDGRCGRCGYQNLCGGSRARAFAASGDPLGEDPLCAWEPEPPGS